MLSMSDFQLITGLTILISGASQLRCGLTAYHWQRVVHIAWFSCITHLCCLTFLRRRFDRDMSLYWWRLPCMIVLGVLLTLALIPTAQYTWYMEQPSKPLRPTPQDYASCYVGNSPHIDKREHQNFQSSQQRMILSAILLLLGMLTRVWHLFDTPTKKYLHARDICSGLFQQILSQMRVWSTRNTLWSHLVATFAYRPCLAAFLTVRLLIDIFASKGFEVRPSTFVSARFLDTKQVWWLGLSFAYGMQNLYVNKSFEIDDKLDGNLWTFGQVLALLVLTAPVITAVEGYMKSLSHNHYLRRDRMLTVCRHRPLPNATVIKSRK